MNKILLLYRKERENFKSIEKVFDAIFQKLSLKNKINLPYHSTSVINIIKNTLFLRRLDYNIIHITGDAHYTAILLQRSKKVILTVHDCVLLQQVHKLSIKYWVYYFFWYKLPMMRANVITAVSEKTKQEILQIDSRLSSKIKMIYNPIDCEFSKREKIFNIEYPTLLQVGTGKNKNLENVIYSIAGLSCKLIIIGKLTDLQKSLLEEYSIDYESFYNIDKKVLVQKYACSDMILFASTYEGFGLPILEAQSIGRALITSNISPMPEVAGEGAYLVDPYKPDSIREGILALMRDDLLRVRLIEHGYNNVARFELGTVAKQYAEIYESL